MLIKMPMRSRVNYAYGSGFPNYLAVVLQMLMYNSDTLLRKGQHAFSCINNSSLNPRALADFVCGVSICKKRNKEIAGNQFPFEMKLHSRLGFYGCIYMCN